MAQDILFQELYMAQAPETQLHAALDVATVSLTIVMPATDGLEGVDQTYFQDAVMIYLLPARMQPHATGLLLLDGCNLRVPCLSRHNSLERTSLMLRRLYRP